MFESNVFESQHHILDGHFLHLFVVKIVLFVSKDRKSTKKKPGIAIFLKEDWDLLLVAANKKTDTSKLSIVDRWK